jgi:predicted DNA binding CopG/RHH family protein
MKKMQKRVLDDEQAMISHLEAGGYEPVSDETAEIERITKLFRENGTKVKRVNIRLTQRDVEKAQALAIREGIPYATLLTNVLHRYLTGRLKEIR